MLSQLQTSYQRLEQSLQRLTDSIAAYNPSTVAAEEVFAADAIITQDLEQLTEHQSNHARIKELRRTTASLDETLKTTIRTLADTRREIQAIPSNTDRSRPKELQVNDLLSYAKFISKTSVQTRKPGEAAAAQAQNADLQAQITNGIATPPGVHDGENAYIKTENVGIKAMDETAKRSLDPMRDLPVEPWPSYAVIQRGSLAEIQRMIDAGRDPGSVLSAEEQAEADRKKREEEEEQERLEAERRELRRMSMFPGGGQRAVQDDVFDPDDL